MRSRYSAFVRLNEAYLLETWHPSTRPASIEFNADQKWLGLRIIKALSHTAGTGEVEFIARYRIGGAPAARLHERSRFVCEFARWFYLNGVILELQRDRGS
jgi:SEC-C motif-containing protein